MKLKSTVVILVVILALMLTTSNEVPVLSQAVEPSIISSSSSEPYPYGPYEKFGPRVDRLTFVVSGGVSRECDDFDAGLMDTMDWAAPAERWSAWFADPEITMGEYDEFGQIFLAFNEMRWPWGHGDQKPESPWTWNGGAGGPADETTYLGDHDMDLWSCDPSSDLPVGNAEKTWIDYDCQRCLDSRWFRRGVAHLVDRASQVAYMQGAGAALEPTIFVPALKGWESPNVTSYAYSFIDAEQCFINGGFRDWDGDKVMEYSPSHAPGWNPGDPAPADMEELPQTQFYTRVDDDHRIYAGQLLSEDMKKLGQDPSWSRAHIGELPHKLIITTYGDVANTVWSLYDYDIYIEYWTWSAMPDIYYELFHSRADIYPEPWANNEDRYHSKEFDLAGDQFYNSSTSADCMKHLYDMQEILHRDAAIIPYYCYVGYQGRRTSYGNWPGEEQYADRTWEGICNFPGEGYATISDGWTYLNAHPQGFEKGGNLRQGLNVDAEMLDIMDAVYYYDGLVLATIYDSLVHFDPYDLTKFEPWLCESYNVGTWDNNGKTCSAVNFTLIPNILWQDGTPMTAEDVAFSFEFTRDCVSINWLYVKDFDSYVIYPDTPEAGRETIEIRFGVISWLALYWCWGCPIIPKHVWNLVGVAGSPAYVPEDYDTVFGTGPFRFYQDGIVGRVSRTLGEYLYLEANPIYFRKYIDPDVCDVSLTPGNKDGNVTGLDFWQVADPSIIFTEENINGIWPTPLLKAWGPHCDVDHDGRIGVGDLMEIGVHYAESWPPPWYNPVTW